MPQFVCHLYRTDRSMRKSKDARRGGCLDETHGDAVYGSHAWAIPGEGELVDGKLKILPGGKLGKQHAEMKFIYSGLQVYSR